ncbi:MAG: HAD family hydrolase [Oscillospiraceae bacterium]|nr:HAD family hydrolase [Oscillospiraceae bacterium]
MKYSALILDMDGTIVDSLDAVEGALKKAGEKWGIAVTPKLLDIALYSSGDDLGRAVNLSGGDEKIFLADVARAYHEMAHLSKLFPGIRGLLEAKISLGIVTNENRTELRHNFKRLEIDESVFGGICCAGDTPFIKPHPYPLQYCMGQMGAARESTLFVGDGRADFLAAKAAGVSFGVALWGVRDVSLFEGAQHFFEKPGEVLRFAQVLGFRL